jgi:hypothetical protein
MDFFSTIFDTLFNWLDLGEANMDEITNYLTVGSDIMNIFSWIKILLPMDVIGFIFGATGFYYGVRAVWGFIRLIRGVVSGNSSLFGMINRNGG